MDGSLSSPLVLLPLGQQKQYNIAQGLGRLAGNNLFYSFRYFDVGQGETALFSTTQPGLKNVIGRVTGGAPSLIDGTIRLSAAGATPSLLLINPSGVTFSSTAAIDVPAAFHVSTANYIKFPDGNFYIDLSRESTFSTAAPGAFGFYGESRATVTLNGASIQAAGGAGTVGLTAGDVSVIGNFLVPGGVYSTTGNIRAIAVGGQAAEVPLEGGFTSLDGTVRLAGGAQLSAAAGTDGRTGEIQISAGSLSVDGYLASAPTGIFSSAGGRGAADIDIAVGKDASFLRGGQVTTTGTRYPFFGAQINLTAESLAIETPGSNFDTGLVSLTNGSGFGGDINVAVDTLAIDGRGALATQPFVGILSRTDGSAASPMLEGPIGGYINVQVSGTASVAGGGSIRAGTYGAGPAGHVSLSASSIDINGGGTSAVTEVATVFEPGSSGTGGLLCVLARDQLSLENGGRIDATTFGSGRAGDVQINAGSMTIGDNGATAISGITSDAVGSGDAGTITIRSKSLDIRQNGFIATDTQGSGDAGLVDIKTSGALSVVDGGSVSSSTSGTGGTGVVLLTADSALTVASGGYVSSSTTGAGDAGFVELSASEIDISDGGVVSSNTTGAGKAQYVQLSSQGAVNISRGGMVESNTGGKGDAGIIAIDAAAVSIDGGADAIFTAVASQATASSTGNSGIVLVNTPGEVSVVRGGSINSDIFSSGDGGSVTVLAGYVTLDGGTSTHATAISSSAFKGSTGNAGSVLVQADGAVNVIQGGLIRSVTNGAGSAGDVTVNADSLQIDRRSAPANLFTGVSSGTNGDIHGNAGSVSVKVNSLSVDNNNNQLLAGINSKSGYETGIGGAAGDVSVQVSGTATLRDLGTISTATATEGPAGNLVFSAATVDADTGIIESRTTGAGAAGSIVMSVGTLDLKNTLITSAAEANSGGQAGSITIGAAHMNLTGGSISIQNDGTTTGASKAASTAITIDGGSIRARDTKITATSTGNVDAGSVVVNFDRSFRLDGSSIQTSANEGNGGAISIAGEGPLYLEHSNVTTSVRGATGGNGGDIRVAAPYVVLDTGVIQANTDAFKASGGNVTLTSLALVPSYGSYLLGGESRAYDSALAGLNLVQAVAPTGVSGDLNVTVPSLDLGSALVGLVGAPRAPLPLGRNVCQFTSGSSFVLAGRGGLAPTAADPLWFDPDETSATTPQSIRLTNRLASRAQPCQ